MTRSPGKARVHTLSIFLMKDGFTSVARCLKADATCERMRVSNKGTAIGELVWHQNDTKPPRWLSLFEDVSNFKAPTVFNASNAAILFVKQDQRMFALAFGFGRHLLASGAWEEQFGLRVTLNTVDPQRLRSIDRKTFDAIASHSRTQTSQAAEVQAFGLKVEQDLLCAATGEPLDKTLGKRMTGMDALTVSVATTLDDLPDLLDRYLGKFRDTTYKKDFSWIDHIGEVRDKDRRKKLDDALVEVLRHEDVDDMRAWLSVPDLIDWARVDGVRYYEKRGELDPDLHLRAFFETLRDRTALTLDTLKHRHAFAIGVHAEEVVGGWPIYDCLYCELEHAGTTYLLSGGGWYRVDQDFVGSVNKAVAKLVRRAPLPLPPYDDDSETDYNRRAAKATPKKLALMDKKLIRIGGSAVEPCDLFGMDNEMIHVKRYGGSAVLSHLFAQGSVAAQAFFQDAAFRVEFSKRLPRGRKLKDPDGRPSPPDYEVVYAIVSRSEAPINESLPFFSRLNLRTAARQLQGFGYRVSVLKIPVAAQ